MNGYEQANAIRHDALTGAFSVVRLAEKYNRPVSTVYRILQGHMWADSKTKPIRIQTVHTDQTVANIHILHQLGFTYGRIGRYIGKVEDIILNLQKGEIMRITLAPLKSGFLSKSKVEEILKENSIGYQDVEEVGDIVLVKPTVRVSVPGEKKGHKH